jgi:uncharacterized protein (TIGR02145 family)
MKKVNSALLTAALVFATALALSCSDDSGGNGNNGSNPIKKDKISGVSQKGPFVKGSSATLYELNEEFAQTGRSFRDIIADDYGKFEIKNVELASPYAMLEADGFYRNEVTGKTSSAPIKLYAIADIREKDNVNVNLLTHLEYYRVLNLVENGKTVAEAKKQAQKEILAVFGINGDFENSEDMSIFGTTEGDAALLAISILLQGDLPEGDFSQRLTDFAQDLKLSGTWGNEAAKKAMADWAASGANLKGIQDGILGWGLSSEVPDFGKYVTDYWNVAYGLGGCGSANSGEVKKDNRDIYRICKNNVWQAPFFKERYCFENECKYFVDSRDNQQYAYAVIGGQTWMIDDLNYNAEGSGCYPNDPANCADGRFYDWETAMTVCPEGWRLPSNEEWFNLFRYADGRFSYDNNIYNHCWWNNRDDDYDTGFGYCSSSDYNNYYSSFSNSKSFPSLVRCVKD